MPSGEAIVLMLGKLFLRFIRTFHYWHRHHLQISLSLLALAGVGFVLQLLGFPISEWRNVPLEWEHWLGIATTLFFGIYLLLIFTAKAAAGHWPPPVVPFVTLLPQPIESPASGIWVFQDARGLRYRFRYAEQSDIPSFCALAMADPAIVATYSYLNELEWKELYARWLEADGLNLMVLQRFESEIWKVIGVSIVIPLSPDGARDLWTGKIGTVDIVKSHMALQQHRPYALLLDLVAADRRAMHTAPEIVFSLAKVHLAQRWKPWQKRKMEVWIEPVHRALPHIIEELGFEGPHKTSKGLTLYRLEIPPAGQRLSERQRETYLRIAANIKECTKWGVA